MRTIFRMKHQREVEFLLSQIQNKSDILQKAFVAVCFVVCDDFIDAWISFYYFPGVRPDKDCDVAIRICVAHGLYRRRRKHKVSYLIHSHNQDFFIILTLVPEPLPLIHSLVP